MSYLDPCVSSVFSSFPFISSRISPWFLYICQSRGPEVTLGCCAGQLGTSLLCGRVVGQGKGLGPSPSCPL